MIGEPLRRWIWPQRLGNGRSSPNAALNSIFAEGLNFICDQPPALFMASRELALNSTLPVAPPPRPAMARPRYNSPESENQGPRGKSQSAVAAQASTVRPNP